MDTTTINHFSAPPKLKLLPYDSKSERGWHRKVLVGDVTYRVGVTRGKRVRIAFKPRGPDGWGYWWYGYVREISGREIWSGQVDKSIGAKGILHFAGVLDDVERVRKQTKRQPYWPADDMRKIKFKTINAMTHDVSSGKETP